MAATAEAAPGDSIRGFSTAAVLEVVAAGAGLAGWVVVVGGAHMWARLDAAHFAPTPSVAFQPREALLVEGLRALLFPLVAGAFVAVIGWYTWSPPPSVAPPEEDFEAAFQRWLRTDQGRNETALWWADRPPTSQQLDPLPDLRTRYAQRVEAKTAPGDDLEGSRVRDLWTFIIRSPGLLIVGIVALLAAGVYIITKYHGLSILWTLLLTVAVVIGGFFAVPLSTSRRGRSLILFAGVVLWAGAADILLVSGIRHPKFDLALVVRKTDHSSVAGFFVARKDGDVYLAKKLETLSQYRILMIPKEDVDSFSFGPSRGVRATDAFNSDQLKRTVFAKELQLEAASP
jgi:hypothetical protein